ncbi:MAG: hypothetical protein HQL38_12185 [Alphaproteobacteria bacterium]|nr:hypothetical protein [Alphaproteobacteria bacterium]
MAIAMSILGLMLGGGILAMTAVLDKAAHDKTLSNMDKIETALLVYVLANDSLPCPDTDYDGNENAGCTGTAARGIVPYRTVGLQRDEASDGFNRFISYAVDVTYTAASSLQCGTTAFAGLDGLLQIRDSTDAYPQNEAAGGYALIYHGKNGLGAVMNSGVVYGRSPVVGTQPAEHQNSLLAATNLDRFYSEPLTASPNVGFDDVIRAKAPARILYDAGCTSG